MASLKEKLSIRLTSGEFELVEDALRIKFQIVQQKAGMTNLPRRVETLLGKLGKVRLIHEEAMRERSREANRKMRLRRGVIPRKIAGITVPPIDPAL